MNKRVTIELIQSRLGSGDAPADLRRRYSYQEIERILGITYSDMGYMDAMALQDMALSYSATVVPSGAQYEATLPVKAVGSFGIISVESGNYWYPVYQGAQEQFILGIANPNMRISCQLVNANKLVFKRKPEDDLVVVMVPDFKDLEDSDEIIMPGGLSTLFEACLRVMQATDGRQQERFNDNRDDNIPKANEWQSGK